MSHGRIDGNGRYIKYEDPKHILRMGGGSWTINLEEFTKEVKIIHYITPDRIYSITAADARKHGFTKTFAGERKLIVSVKHWHIKEKSNG